MHKLRTSVIVCLVLAVALLRAFNHVGGPFAILPQFSPLGAIALFAGAMLARRWQALALTLGALFVSDALMMRLYYPAWADGLLYDGWYVTYALFALMALAGRAFAGKPGIFAAVVGGVGAGLGFWLLSNLAMWTGGTNVLTGLPFPKTWEGLTACYALALPFLRDVMMGNLLYGAVLFGGYALAAKRLPAAATA